MVLGEVEGVTSGRYSQEGGESQRGAALVGDGLMSIKYLSGVTEGVGLAVELRRGSAEGADIDGNRGGCCC